MVHTFSYLYKQVMAQIDERGDVDTTRELAQEYVNIANALRSVEFGEFFLVVDGQFPTAPNQQDYALSELFDKPIYFLNTATKQYLIEVPNRTIEPENYNLLTGQGSAEEFAYWGVWPVTQQPPLSTGSRIRVTTSNAADLSDIIVSGLDLNGNTISEAINLSGGAGTGAVFFTKILQVRKTAITAGVITVMLFSVPGGPTILSLLPSEDGKQFRVMHVFQAPTTPETIVYRYYRKPLVMTSDYDVADIPYPYSQLLVFDALLLLAAYNTDTMEKSIAMWTVQRDKWEEALRDTYKNSQTLGARSQYTRGVTRTYFGSDD